MGGEAAFRPADVTLETEVEGLVADTVAHFGRLDCAHNNAGVTGAMGAVHQIEQSGLEETLAINLTGVFLCLKHEIVHMLGQGGGAIVNTSSRCGLRRRPGPRALRCLQARHPRPDQDRGARERRRPTSA